MASSPSSDSPGEADGTWTQNQGERSHGHGSQNCQGLSLQAYYVQQLEDGLF